MIFDCPSITDLVMQWQGSKDRSLEPLILDGCKNLIEAIVSQFDAHYRDDLIQEAYIRILYACNFYTPSAGNLHNYFTSVIRNTCITWLSKQPKDYLVEDIATEDNENDDSDTYNEYVDVILEAEQSDSESTLLMELTERNRKRFPSLPVKDIDDLSEHIYYTLKTSGNFPKDLPKVLADKLCLPSAVVKAVCNSSVIWLRYNNLSSAKITDITDEFSLLKDLEELIDSNTYRMLRIIFSGMTLRMN
jgi:RNA polymerase sigma factor (sigma-70 family)